MAKCEGVSHTVDLEPGTYLSPAYDTASGHSKASAIDTFWEDALKQKTRLCKGEDCKDGQECRPTSLTMKVKTGRAFFGILSGNNKDEEYCLHVVEKSTITFTTKCDCVGGGD